MNEDERCYCGHPYWQHRNDGGACEECPEPTDCQQFEMPASGAEEQPTIADGESPSYRAAMRDAGRGGMLR